MADRRLTRLNDLFEGVLRSKRDLKSDRELKTFLEAIHEQKSPADSISRLIASDEATAALQRALSSDVSLAFVNGRLTKFLVYLQANELETLCGGDVLQRVVRKMVEAPVVWTSFVKAAKDQILDQPALAAFAWLLIRLLSLPAEEAATFLPVAQDASIQRALTLSTDADIRLRGQRIAQIAQTLAGPSAANGHSLAADEPRPGGRHDNDFAEIRKISIYPTANELKTTDVYLPKPEDSDPGARAELAAHIDSQFRLLREDMLCELREELQNAIRPSGRKSRSVVVDGLELAGFHCDERQPWALRFKCSRGLPIFHQVPISKRKQLLKDKHRYLKHGSLVCLMRRNENEIIALGALNRDEDLLCQKHPVICVQIPGSDAQNALPQFREASMSRVGIVLLQVDVAMFSYEPVLQQLKETRELSLETEIIAWQSGDAIRAPDYTMRPVISMLLKRLETDPTSDLQLYVGLRKSTRLDSPQTKCFRACLQQRVAVIQGPPGTGKSFIGSLVGKAIHHASQEQILVVCYTHHALDDFVEDLLNLGIPDKDIVRLGNAQKATPRTKALSLYERQGSTRFTEAQRKLWGASKSAISMHGAEMLRLFPEYSLFRPSKQELLDHLEFTDEELPFFDAFQVPAQNDGMTLVGKKGKNVGPYYLLDRWIAGEDSGLFKQVQQEYKSVWDLPPGTRLLKRGQWEQELLRERLRKVQQRGKEYNDALETNAAVRLEQSLGVIRKARIIACTTTAAAKYNQILRSVAPGVVMVEEAGEILESHVLTALGPSTKHIILIGDHKQLRPKCTYNLSVEKGLGYDLNRSLFERLILKGFPHQVLLSQHRMRPEISSLIRALTYPDLTDADSTKARPDLRGFTDNIIFVNHDEPEVELSHARELGDESTSSSKQNSFEADMTLKCVKYLAQQGYRTDNMVVLTPYLGQLRLLLDNLRGNYDPVLDDIDSHDLVKAGLMPPATAQVNKERLRISTIDNYQGEEADVVVVSLTRSNANNDIGFMHAPERLNVLLSRARDALILIGNAENFMGSKKGSDLWTRFISLMKADNHVYDGFPVRCERHPTRTALLKTARDFEILCPDGGCDQPCDKTLSCGSHKCPDRCHLTVDHSKIPCGVVIQSPCSRGHLLKRKCSESEPKTCSKCKIEDAKARREAERRIQEQAAQEAHLLAVAEINREIQALRDEATSEAQTAERQAVLEQKKRELEQARQIAAARAAQEASKPTQSKPEAQGTPEGPSLAEDFAKLSVDDHVDKEAPVPPSSAEADWARQKSVEGASNDAIDALMAMTGLEAVKDKMLDLKAKIETSAEQGTDITKERLGVTMLGNPGTGKTTVARIYGKFLSSIGAILGSDFVESSGSSLANDGVAGAKKKIEDLDNAGGGIFFLDEAYQLASGNSYAGKSVLDYLLAEIEERRGKIVFILAGYQKDMEKFFEHNPGFASRMPHQFNFADYTNAELLSMIGAMITKKYKGKAELEDGLQGLFARIMVARLGRRRGTEGYGNARDLENVWAQVTERQAGRIRRAKRDGKIYDPLVFTKADIIGPEPSLAARDSKAWKKLNDLIGLREVKVAVKTLVECTQTNYQRELKEEPPLQFSLNKLFIGSPGTGKTTVAKLYGTILADMGLLTKGEVIIKTPADFVGSVLGESEKNTKTILRATQGKVLLIDEAYGLNPAMGSIGGKGALDPYKAAVIDTIVAEVQSVPGEDRCVLLLGYDDPMLEMLRNANPGLSRRFPTDSAFRFEDFDDAALRKIVDLKLKDQGISATSEAKEVAIGLLARLRDRPNFGNAGEVENMLSRAKQSWQRRLQGKESDVLFQPEDFDPEYDRTRSSGTNVCELFSDIVGLHSLVVKLEEYQKMVVNLKARGKDPRQLIPFNFVFKGPPGTGKTTVARRMASFYYEIGILPTKEFIECSASELVAQYVGQSAPQTREKLRSALGKVLFIDEAYRLQDGQFGKEAVNEIVDCLTKTEFIGKIVVILAGYTEDINQLLQVNQGLASRFPEEVFFESMAPGRCLALLHKLLSASDLGSSLEITSDLQEPASSSYQEFSNVLSRLSELPGWGNGRDVTTLSKKVLSAAIQDAKSGTTSIHVEPELILAALNQMLAEQQARAQTKPQTQPSLFQSGAQKQAPPPPTSQPSISTSTAIAETEPEPEPPHSEAQEPEIPTDAQRDAGVSDEIWTELQQDALVQQQKAEGTATDLAALKQAAEAAAREVAAAEKEKKKLLVEMMARAAQGQAEEDDARRRAELARIRAVEAKRAKDEEEARLRAKLEEEVKRREQERQVQVKLRNMGVCVAGFCWIKQSSGYRCAGGSHFVDNAALGI